MFRTMMIVLVSFFFSTAAWAQSHGGLQYQTIVKNGQALPRFVLTNSAVLNSRFGWSVYAQLDRNWSEVYIGPTYTPRNWLRVGVQTGLESKTRSNRSAVSGWIGYKQYSTSMVREYGASGGLTVVELKATHRYGSTSYLYDTPRGHGLKLTLKATKAYSLWASAQTNHRMATYRYAAQYNY